MSKTNISLNLFSRSEEKVLRVKSNARSKIKSHVSKSKEEECPLSVHMERMALNIESRGMKRKSEAVKTADQNINKKAKIQ